MQIIARRRTIMPDAMPFHIFPLRSLECLSPADIILAVLHRRPFDRRTWKVKKFARLRDSRGSGRETLILRRFRRDRYLRRSYIARTIIVKFLPYHYTLVASARYEENRLHHVILTRRSVLFIIIRNYGKWNAPCRSANLFHNAKTRIPFGE